VGFLLWGTLPDKGWVCNLLVQLLLGLVITVTVGSKSHKTHHCLIWDSLNLVCQILYLYPPGTGWPSYMPGHWVPFLSPLMTRRDYGGGILTRLHMRIRIPNQLSKSELSYLTTAGQSASLSWCQATIRARDQFSLDRCRFVILWHPL
jgi:hypothetical protein